MPTLLVAYQDRSKWHDARLADDRHCEETYPNQAVGNVADCELTEAF
jgi:hypothetical protein